MKTAAEQRVLRKQHPAKYREYSRKSYANNREKILATLRADRKANPEKYRERAKRYHAQHAERYSAKNRRRKYKLTSAEFSTLEAQQGGRCAVCRSLPDGKHKVLVVDHCHATEVVRGLLCNACNLSLGALKDDPLRIRALAAYVEQFDWLKN